MRQKGVVLDQELPILGAEALQLGSIRCLKQAWLAGVGLVVGRLVVVVPAGTILLTKTDLPTFPLATKSTRVGAVAITRFTLHRPPS